MEASEATVTEAGEAPEAPEAPAPEPTTPPATPDEPVEPNVGEALKGLNERLDQMSERLPGRGEQEEGTGSDFFEQLAAEDFDPESEFGGEQALYEGEGQEDPEAQLREAIRAEARAEMEPVLDQLEMDRRADAIAGLADRYEDFNEHTAQIGEQLRSLAEDFGPEMGRYVQTHPGLVEALYKAAKADAVAAAETPAEATGEGSQLETGAGPGVVDSGPSDQEQMTKLLLGGMPGGDAFT